MAFCHWAHSYKCFFSCLFQDQPIFHCWKAKMGLKLSHISRTHKNYHLRIFRLFYDQANLQYTSVHCESVKRIRPPVQIVILSIGIRNLNRESTVGFISCSHSQHVGVWRIPSKISTPDHLLLESAPNLGPLIPCWEINKFENCWYNNVRILGVWDMSGPILGDLSNNRWSWSDTREHFSIGATGGSKNWRRGGIPGSQ
jgi:hypothetical protein